MKALPADSILVVFVSLCCCLSTYDGCLEKERDALMQIRDSVVNLDGSFPYSESWAEGDCCKWKGVTCSTSSSSSQASHVTKIELSFLRDPDAPRTWYPNSTSFAQVTELQSLDLTSNNIGGWVNPKGLCSLKKLRQLNLGENNMGVEAFPPCLLSSLSLLEELDLSGNNLGGDSSSLLAGLCGLKNLRVLRLGETNLDGRAFLPCLQSNLTQIETLGLSSINLGGDSSGFLKGLCNLRKLQWLDLGNTNLGNGALPLCLPNNPNQLEYLVLDSHNLGNGSCDSLTGLCSLSKLQTLYLGNNSLGNGALPSCLGNNLTLLESLDLSDNYLGRDSSGGLTGLCSLRKLRTLDLNNNSIVDGALPPCLLHNLTLLEFLYLSENNLGKDSSDSLAGLCGLRRLESLFLDNNNLEDQSLSPCLGNLSSLKILVLSSNKVKSPFGISSKETTSVRPFANLRTLDLSENLIADDNVGNIVPWFYNLTSLTYLYLSRNLLRNSSTLTWLCKLRTLKHLYVMNNTIEGHLHPCMRAMYSLNTLSLSHNQLTGNVPSFIFNNLTMLEVIDLSENQLSGVLYFSMFANLSKLSFIDLSNNNLQVETEYPHWIPTFHLSRLYLKNCNLNLHSTRGIPTFISNQNGLRELYLDHNTLKGIIPPWLLYKSALQDLSLRRNLFEGSFPQSPNNTSGSTLRQLDISTNNLYGTLPTSIGMLLPMVTYLNISGNVLEGNIPSSLTQMDFLEVLDLSYNRLSGEIPYKLMSFISLLYLDLSHNCLQGNMLPKDSNMTKLRVLHLSHNFFTGSIPTSLLNSSFLEILDVSYNNLSGPIPNWIFNLLDLVSLVLKNNFFQSHISRQLCQVSNLHLLDLSNNSLVGKIPSCLNNITSWKRKTAIQIHGGFYSTTNARFSAVKVSTPFTTKGRSYIFEGVPLSLMTGIDLSMNKLTGSIPVELGDLKELHSLNLSFNLLTGPIHRSFKNFKNLESLDLSHNNLFGRIPYEIAGIDTLTTFSVAFNNLSGKIPFSNQFSTFNESSYEGNPRLCGEPLKRICSSSTSSEVLKRKRKDPSVLKNIVAFYSFVAISYALGFWGIISFLLLNKSWRCKYFETMDAYWEALTRKIFLFYLRFKNCSHP